jgi:mannitol/fructose-specific phosphotransferase system IIA component (Ntr-type)
MDIFFLELETDARRGRGVYARILQAMENLREAGVPFGILMTATRENAEAILSDELVDYYFKEQGAIYGWIFQYMPIGRSYSVNLMVSAEQRAWMLERELHMIHERDLFLVDFWNGGITSVGCISAGRPGGYFCIDWNGNIAPCVFFPYTKANVYDLYERDDSLTSLLEGEYFSAIRSWQDDYLTGGKRVKNLFLPCPMRDHYDFAHQLVISQRKADGRKCRRCPGGFRVPTQNDRVQRAHGEVARSAVASGSLSERGGRARPEPDLPMKISDVLSVDRILFRVRGTTKAEIIDKLTSLLANDHHVRNHERIREAVHDRERIMSTAVGNGFAIPHAKTDWVSGIVMACGVLDTPTDFDSFDSSPVDLVFLIVSNESHLSSYVQLISRIATIMNKDGLRAKLTEARSANEIYDLLCKEEDRYERCNCTLMVRGVS